MMIRKTEFIFMPDFVIGLCTNMKGAVKGSFLIDYSSYKLIKDIKWSMSTLGYIHNTKIGLLHRFLTNCPENRVVDHINRDPTDNRLSNLRVVDSQINNFNVGISKNNSSGYKGVSWHKQNKRWRAYIMLDFKQISLGLFDTKDEAYRARLEAENNIMKELLSKMEEIK